MEEKYGLLIAALVAIVAIVGLVILFSGGPTGAYVEDRPHYSALGGMEQGRVQLQSVPGGKISRVWVGSNPPVYEGRVGLNRYQSIGRPVDSIPASERSFARWPGVFTDPKQTS